MAGLAGWAGLGGWARLGWAGWARLGWAGWAGWWLVWGLVAGGWWVVAGWLVAGMAGGPAGPWIGFDIYIHTHVYMFFAGLHDNETPHTLQSVPAGG